MTEPTTTENETEPLIGRYLAALCAGTRDPIRLIYGDTTVDVPDTVADVIQAAGNQPVYCSPVTATGLVSFIYSVEDGEAKHAVAEWVAKPSIKVKPTVILARGDKLMIAYALEKGVPADDADLIALAAAAGCDLTEPLPTPDADGWVMVHVDDSIFHDVDTLSGSFGLKPAKPEGQSGVKKPLQARAPLPDLGKFRDATIRRAFDPNDPALLEPVTVMRGDNHAETRWRRWTTTRVGVLGVLCDHLERREKDGKALVFASFAPGPRSIETVENVSFVGLDIDTGFDGDEIAQAILDSGLMAVLASTHSHMKTTTVLSHDPLVIWMDKTMPGTPEITLDVVKAYMAAKGVDPTVIATAEFEIVKGKKNREVVVTHAPLQRWRVIFPLDTPFVISENGRTDREGRENWRAVPTALAKVLGDLPLDRTGSDPNRLFYTTGHVPGAEWRVDIFGGKMLNAAEIIAKAAAMPAGASDLAALVEAEFGGKGGGTFPGPFDRRWAAEYAAGFEFADLIRDFSGDDGERKVRGSNGKFLLIKCPFHEDHSEIDTEADTACAVVNASENDDGGFSAACQHNSCKHVNQRDRLDFMNKALAEGWFTFEQAMLPAYHPLQKDTPSLAAVAAGPITIAEVQALTVESSQEDVEAVVARIARLPKFQQGGRMKALVKATRMSTPDAKAMIKDATAEAVPPLPKPAATLAPILAQIPLPSAAHGDFKIAAFDGKPWVYESRDDEKGAGRRLYTPWGVSGGAVYMDRDQRVGLQLRVLNRSLGLTEIDAPYGLIADGKAFRAELISRGVSMTTGGGERAADLVAQYQPDNPLEIYDRPGWRKPGMFLTAWGEVITADPDAEPTIGLSRSSMPKGAARSGTLDGWIAATKAAFDLGLIQLQLSGLAAFASPIIDLCNYESRTLFFSGGAGRGKSTGHLIQTSAWGDPKPKAGLFGTFSTTVNAPEVVLQQGSGCGVAFDEVKSLRGGNLQTFLFDVWSGVGRSRMDYRSAGLKDTNSWRLMFTASYEDPLATKIKGDGDQVMPGLGARVLEVTVNGTEVRTDLIPAVEAVKTNFGWSGPAFVRALFDQGWVDHPEALKEAIAEKAERLKAFRRSDQPRSATTAAILWQAGEIAIEAGLLPEAFPMMPADDIVMKPDENQVAFDEDDEEEDEAALNNAESDLERLMLMTWRNATLADSAATDTLTKAVNTLIRNLVTSIGTSVADGSDGHTNRERLAFRIDGFQAVPKGATKRVFVIPIDSVSTLADAPVDHRKIARALEARGLLIPYPRAPTADGRARKAERRWPRVPGLGEAASIVIDATAIE